MSEPKTTIDLPFSPEEVRAGTVRSAEENAKYNWAWQIVQSDPELAFARKKLSMHELRHIIRAVAQAFS